MSGAGADYPSIIRGAMRGVAQPIGAEPAGTLRVERGEIFPLALLDAGPAALAAAGGPLVAVRDVGAVDVEDASGHRRGHYRPLLAYCWLRAYEAASERSASSAAVAAEWAAPLARWCAALGAEAVLRPDAGGTFAAARGEEIAGAAWAAVALCVGADLLGGPVRDAGAADAFRRLIAAQSPEGPFLRPSPSDNPETLWFHELVLLHAASAYAAQSGDAAVTAAVRRHAEWVQRETQPDHATSQPWGLPAFVLNAQTRPTADALLHAVRVQHPGGPGGVSLMLLADTLYCLRRTARPAPGG